jgi:preflagellin peptidase FlaK
MLIITSILDLKYREVGYKYWITFSSIGAITLLYEIVTNNLFNFYSILSYFIIPIVISSLIALAVYWFGFYGGADALAIISITITMPTYSSPHIGIHNFTGIVTLTNSIILTLTLPLTLVVINISKVLKGENIFKGFEEENKLKKLVAFFLGYRARKVPKFSFAIEEYINGKKRFKFSVFGWSDEYAVGEDVWITPGIPLLIFITIGFIVAVFWGDIIFYLMRILFSLLI